MSDFIYSNKTIPKSKLEESFKRAYRKDSAVSIFSTEMCCLAITENIYNGFSPYKAYNHICVVIGGPVLQFRDNKFITTKGSCEGTKSIYERWIIEKTIIWDKDLDGPFVVLLFDLNTGNLEVVTDLLSFIPVFQNNSTSNILVGTHINTLDFIQPCPIDQVSVADFIMNYVVTFPHTILKDIEQVFPASVHTWVNEKSKINYSYKNYWLPYESANKEKDDLPTLAKRLRAGMNNYINRILEASPKVGILMSGGEDSRSVVGMIPKKYPKTGFIYSESENDEIAIAKKIAQKNNVKLNIAKMHKSYFAENMEACSDLIGVGADGSNVHSYGFYKSLGFDKYDAILGGFLADTFLKSLWATKRKKKFSSRIFGIKDHIAKINECHERSHESINSALVSEVNNRRRLHWECLKKIRPNTIQEWMGIWPISMQRDIPNIYGHRRIFRNFEPFTSNEVIKVGVIASQEIKLNRILFQRSMKPVLKQMKWVPHNAGHLPYYPYWINNILFIPLFRVLTRLRCKQGSTLANWSNVFKHPLVKQKEKLYLSFVISYCDKLFANTSDLKILDNPEFNDFQKRNILQLGYFLSMKEKHNCDL